MREDHRQVTRDSGPLLAPRAVVPALPDGFVDRPRLHQLIDAGIRGPVTLLAAPAGWGKTVLLSAWSRTAGSVGWLSVEPGDDRGFWQYLSATIGAASGLEQAAADQAVPPTAWMEPPADGAFLVTLADALAQRPEPLVLIIDNFHHLHDHGVLHGLEFLLRHAASRLRLIISARGEPALPLHRWRLSGELTEVRAPELSFSVPEAAALMARHGLAVPDARIAELAYQTEGWPAGLRLAALALGRPAGLAVEVEFSGEDPSVADYLTDEVLEVLPVEVRDAMVSTSVLEWVCGGLVDALTGRTDGDRVLSEITHANAFVISRGTRPLTYRYNRIFGEFLRGEMRRRAADLGPELHRRAASWLADNGLPADALWHALAAEDWSRATRLFVAHWPELGYCAHYHDGRAVVPPPPALAVSSEPELALAFAAYSLQIREQDIAEHYLQLACQQPQLVGEGRGEQFALMVAALRLTRAQLGGDQRQVQSLATELLALVGTGPASLDRAPSDPATRAVALAALGSSQLGLGDLDLAERTLAAGLAEAERVGLVCPYRRCLGQLALVYALRGRLVAADDAACAAQSLPACPGQRPATHSAPAHLASAIVDLHWDRLAEAEPHMATAAARCDPSREPALTAMIASVRSQLWLERGDLDTAYETLQATRRQLTGQRLSPDAQHRLAVAEADVRAARGDTGAVREILEPFLGQAGPRQVAMCTAIARSYLQDDDAGDAARILPSWSEEPPAAPLAERIDAGLVDALTAQRLGDRRRSSWALERALGLAEPEGFRRVFTGAGSAVHDLLVGHLDSGTAYWWLVNELVIATRPAERQPPVPAPSRPERLTHREMTVLRYLQSVLSTPEIAAELHVSVNTVKTHLRNIYRKLGTTRRRDAVRRGRELHLL